MSMNEGAVRGSKDRREIQAYFFLFVIPPLELRYLRESWNEGMGGGIEY